MSLLHLMELLTRPPGPLSNLLTPEQAAEQERLGFQVVRIPIAKPPEGGEAQ